MAKKVEEQEVISQDFEIDDTQSLEEVEVQKPIPTNTSRVVPKRPVKEEHELVNCLSNTRVIVRHIPK